jgi:hypothetical protein
MSWSAFLTLWGCLCFAACVGGGALIRNARAQRDDELCWAATLWLIGTLPSVIAAAVGLAAALSGKIVARSVIGVLLVVGSIGGPFLFFISAAASPKPRNRYLWMSVRLLQLGAWAGGCLMALAWVLDV